MVNKDTTQMDRFLTPEGHSLEDMWESSLVLAGRIADTETDFTPVDLRSAMDALGIALVTPLSERSPEYEPEPVKSKYATRTKQISDYETTIGRTKKALNAGDRVNILGIMYTVAEPIKVDETIVYDVRDGMIRPYVTKKTSEK